MKKEREGIFFDSAEKLKYLLFCTLMTFLQCNYEKMLEFEKCEKLFLFSLDATHVSYMKLYIPVVITCSGPVCQQIMSAKDLQMTTQGS